MSMSTPHARAFINRFQGGFPLTSRPFLAAAAELGTTEAELIQIVECLLHDGVLSRFGPLYDAARLGGSLTLAALAVPEARFDEVAGLVNSLPGVAHNYRRDHRLNMWFVVACDSPHGVASTLVEIERLCGLPVYDFPKQREFYLGLWLQLGDDGAIDTVTVPGTAARAGCDSVRTPPLDADDRALIAATQAGLPLYPEPYALLANQLGMSEEKVLARLRAMCESGAIRRIGAVPNHYRLGLRGNGMTVWDIDDARVEELGARIGALDWVSHCYQRPRQPGIWRYNLFAMVHGRDRAEVLAKTTRLAAELGDAWDAHEVLFSSAVLKKTGLRVAA